MARLLCRGGGKVEGEVVRPNVELLPDVQRVARGVAPAGRRGVPLVVSDAPHATPPK